MHAAKKSLIIVVAVIAVSAVVIAGLWVFALSPKCNNEVLNRNLSPDGRYEAVLFERDCGATTSYLRVVALTSTTRKFNAEEYENWIFVGDRQPRIKVEWTDAHHISVYSDTNDVSTSPVTTWKDISVSRSYLK